MLNADIQMFLPKEVSDNSTNGGVVDFTKQVISGVIQNVWDHVPKAERDAGSDKDRKVFLANRNASNEPMYNGAVIYDGDTLGDDYAFFFPTTQRSTQADWQPHPAKKYASGVLKTDTQASDTSLTIVFAHADQAAMPADGDDLYISDKVDPDSSSGVVLERTISGTPVVVSNECTVTLSTAIGAVLVASITKICMMYKPGADVKPTIDNKDITGVAGSGDINIATIDLDNLGTVEHELTFDFTSSTEFACTSDDPDIGSLGTGNITTTFSPNNPNSSTPYFVIGAADWIDTGFALNDVVKFQTHPATIPTVQNRVVPASTPSLSNNRLRVVVTGESAT